MKKFFQKLFPTLFPTEEVRIKEAIDRIEYHINLNRIEIEVFEQELKFLERRLREIRNQK